MTKMSGFGYFCLFVKIGSETSGFLLYMCVYGMYVFCNENFPSANQVRDNSSTVEKNT
jgi:hypothetical protein